MAPDSRLPVLHALRIKGFATVVGITVFTGLDREQTDRLVTRCVHERLAWFRGGRISAWTLTADGRALHGELIAEERTALGRAGIEAVADTYVRFLGLDETFKELCTRWQQLGRTAGALAVLDQLHEAITAVVEPASATLPRLGVYRLRFEGARARLVDGDDGALTRPLAESYHDVWMELHEDLLVTLGRDRWAGDGS